MSSFYETQLYSNIIFHIKSSTKHNVKFNNIPQDIFDAMLSKAHAYSKPHTSTHYVVFYGVDNTKHEVCLDSNESFQLYFEQMLQDHIDNADAFQNYKIRKSSTKFTTPQHFDFKLKIDEEDTNQIEMIKKIWKKMKIIKPLKSNPIKFYDHYDKQVWVTWMDELEIIYFQPSMFFDYANGQCSDHKYGLKYNERYPYYGFYEYNESQMSKTQTKCTYTMPILYLDFSMNFFCFECKETQILETLPSQIYFQLNVLNSVLKKHKKRVISETLVYEEKSLDMLCNYISKCKENLNEYLIHDIFEDWNLHHIHFINHGQSFAIRYLKQENDEDTMIIHLMFHEEGLPNKRIPQFVFEGPSYCDDQSYVDVKKWNSFWKQTKYGRYLEKLRLSFILKKGIVFHDNIRLFVHSFAVEKFPEYLMKLYTTKSFRQVEFLDDEMYPENNGDSTQRFLHMLGKSLFKPIPLFSRIVLENFERMLDMDEEYKFPKFTLQKTSDEKTKFTSDLVLFWDVLIEKKHGNIGNVLPLNLVNVLNYLDTFQNLLLENKLHYNDFHQFTPEMHWGYHNIILDLTLNFFPHCDTQVAFASFIKDYLSFETISVGNPMKTIVSKKDDLFEPRMQELNTIMHHLNHEEGHFEKLFDFGMNSILRPKVEPILEFLFYLKMAMQQMKHDFEANKQFIFGVIV